MATRSVPANFLAFLTVAAVLSPFGPLGGASPGRGEEFGPVSISQIPLYETHEATRRGYAGYLFQVKNRSKDPHLVRVEYPSGLTVGLGGKYLVENGRSVQVGPEQSAHVWLYQPPVATFGGQAAVFVDGKRHRDWLSVDEAHTALDNETYIHGHASYAPYPTPTYPYPAPAVPSYPGVEAVTESEEESESAEDSESKATKQGDAEEGSGTSEDPDPEETAESELTEMVDEPGPPEGILPAAAPGGMRSGMGYGMGPGMGMGMSGGPMPGMGISGGVYPFSNATAVVLASRQLSGDFRDKLATRVRDCHVVRSVQPPNQWPTNWVVYSRFDGVVISRGEFDTLSPEAKGALADYLSVGGVVWVRPDTAPPKSDASSAAALIEPLSSAAGFGTLLSGYKQESSFRDAVHRRVAHGNKWTTPEHAASRMPVTKQKNAPVWGFLTFLVFYAISIGPVLQFALQRIRRRIWMVWILPASAVVLGGGVFAWSYLSEGFRGLADIRTVTLLNQKTQRASTFGWAGFYSPLTDGDGLTFSAATVVQPQWLDENYDEETRAVSIDWTNGQHLTGGWLLAKTPIHFRLWKVEPRREKIAVRVGDSGEATATNAIGAEVRELSVCLADGSVRTARRIPPGATVSLAKGSKKPSGAPTVGAELIHQIDAYAPDSGGLNRCASTIVLQPGTYMALVEGHPFVNTAITNPASDKGETLVIGQFEREARAAAGK